MSRDFFIFLVVCAACIPLDSASSGAAFLGSGFDASGLVVAGGVEDELTQDFAGVAVDAGDVEVVDEHADGFAGVFDGRDEETGDSVGLGSGGCRGGDLVLVLDGRQPAE